MYMISRITYFELSLKNVGQIDIAMVHYKFTFTEDKYIIMTMMLCIHSVNKGKRSHFMPIILSLIDALNDSGDLDIKSNVNSF